MGSLIEFRTFRLFPRYVDLRQLRERIDLPRHFRLCRDRLRRRDIRNHGISSRANIGLLLQIKGLEMVVQVLLQHVCRRYCVGQNGTANQNPRGDGAGVLHCHYFCSFVSARFSRLAADLGGGYMTHALYELLSDLDDRHLFYTLGRHRPDTILISITVPGERIEIDVFDDGHMEMSRFSGDESVIDDQQMILKAIDETSE